LGLRTHIAEEEAIKTTTRFVGLVAACLFGFGCFGLFPVGTASAADPTLFSNLGQSTDGAGFLPDTSRRLANDFQTGLTPTTITGATLKLANPDGIAHTYTASLWSDNAGLPGAPFATFTPILLPSGTTAGNFATTPSGVINLAASTPYWEVVQVNENRLFVVDPEWERTSSQGTDAGSIFATIASTTPKVSTNSGANWSDLAAGNFQFALTGVPEPTGALLLLVGAPLLLANRRRH
jgi:hypothetical protein